MHSTCSCCIIPAVLVQWQVTAGSAGHLSSGKGLARNCNGWRDIINSQINDPLKANI
jgi:hypothetical protein